MSRPAALALLALAGVAVVGLLTVAGPIAPPWSAACTVTDARGSVLAAGSPTEVSALIGPRDSGGTTDEALAEALGAGPAVSCRIGAARPDPEAKEPPEGLTPRARVLRREVREAFGRIPDGGFGPEAQLPGRRPGSEHNRGRAIDFFFRPHTDPQQAREGWELANWAVANAERLSIRTVIYRDLIWTARRSAQGWRDYRFSGPDPDDPVNRHLDHVHIDVG